MIYERYHTREITDFGGLSRRLPVLSFFMLVLVLSSIGLPGLNGFVGEFLLLLGMFQRGWMESVPVYAWQFRVIAVLAVSGVVLGAWYMLWMVQRVFYGPLKEPKTDGPHEPVRDLCFREIFALALLVIFIVWIGLQPRFFLDRMSPTLKKLTASVIRAAEARGQGAGVQGSGFRVQGAALCADNTAIGIQHLVRSTEYEARRHSLFFQPFEIDLAVCYSPQVLPTFILHFSSFILPPKPGNKLPGPVY